MRQIKAKRPFYQGRDWDSKLELSIYKALELLTKVNPSIKIALQEKVLVRPQSRNYPAKHWKVDFMLWLEHDSKKRLYVEVKGQPQKHDELKEKVKQIDIVSPDAHDRLIVVVPNSYHRKSRGKRIDLRASLARSIRVPVMHQRDLRSYISAYFRT